MNKKKGMKLDLPSLCNDLISALITGGAQGALIIGLVWLTLKLVRHANAATRHGAWFATLIVVALLPAVSFIPSIWSASVVDVPEESIEVGAVETEEAEALATPIEVPPASTAGPLVQTPIETYWTLTLPKELSLGLVACWLLLATIRLAGICAQLWTLRGVKRRATAAPEILAQTFAEIVNGMRISRKPRLLISKEAPAPMVVGFIHPAMLLPKFVLDRSSRRQLEHLFRHELAHLARRDDWTNLAQQVIAAIFFFHPGVLFVSRRLTAEREIACDDHALAIGRAPREYALFLTEFASQMKGRDFTAAPAAWSSNSQLKERIGMILNTKRNASPRVSRAGVGMVTITALGLAAAALVASPRLAIAADEPAIEAAPAAPAAPVIVAQPAPVEPVQVSIASVAPAPTIAFAPPKVNVQVKAVPALTPAPAPVKIAAAQPAADSGPRIKAKSRGESDDDEMERRLERLERMVEELVRRDKPSPPAMPKNPSMNLSRNNELDAQIRNEIEKAHRESDRTRREVETVMRQQKQAAQAQAHAAREAERVAREHHRVAQAGAQSLKARRQALEEQRRSIERELEAIEKQMEKEEDKRGKSEAKEEKKSIDNRDSDDDSKPKK